MFYPSGFGLGSNWLLYIGVPLIIGIWAQIRVTSAFHKWGEVRASSNITGAECAREILQAAQIQDVDVKRVLSSFGFGSHWGVVSQFGRFSGELIMNNRRTYEVKGEAYAELPQYGVGADFDGVKGKSHPFTWKIDGRKWHHQGQLAEGLTIDEVWERVEKK